MVDIGVLYTLVEKETGEGLYVVSTGLVKYIAYARDKEEIKNLKSQKELLNDELLESKGIYLLKNIRELFHNAEEKTRKIIKYMIVDQEKMNSDTMKIFINLLITYIAYQDIYLTAIVKDSTLIDFFKDSETNKENKGSSNRNIKLEILQNLFNYIIEYKGILSKLNISKKHAELNVAFQEIDNRKSIFNKETIDFQAIVDLFNTIDKIFGTKEEEDKNNK